MTSISPGGGEMTGAEIKTAYEAETNAYTDTKNTKLSGIEESADVTDSTNVNAAGATINTDSDVSGNSYVVDEDNMVSNLNTKVPTQQSVKAYVDAAAGLPAGLITMWHGLIANIPTGWVLCNGANSTPDLREKFLRGAPAATEAGGTGGADTHTLSENEMPAHAHAVETKVDGGSTACIDDPAGTTNAHSTIPTTSVGGGAAHNNMPAYYQILYIMKS